MLSVIHTISTGLYGNAILSKDVDMVLRLLRDLIEIQIVVSDNPRRYVSQIFNLILNIQFELNDEPLTTIHLFLNYLYFYHFNLRNRVLRTGSCAFSRLYHRLYETIFSSQNISNGRSL